MKFAHLADCHLGAWREPKLREIGSRVFDTAIDEIIKHNVDFLLISGDLFNTSLPSFDILKQVTQKLKELKDNGISTYMVAGSHDFSPSGKTFLDVLEKAGLIFNVVKGQVVDGRLRLRFTVDKKTNARITGLLGKKGTLEKSYYENLDKENLEDEEGYKIFMFHSALTEFKPDDLGEMEAMPLSLLPKNFNYYAGGHVHYIFSKTEPNYGNITFPGALFPNNFKELEKFGYGGYYLIENDKCSWLSVKLIETKNIEINCDHKNARDVEKELNEIVDINGKIVLIRIKGTLESGKISDINFTQAFNQLYAKGAFFIMKNSSAASTKEFEEIKIDTSDIEHMEEKLIKEHLGQIKVDDFNLEVEEKISNLILQHLNTEKEEGQTKSDFEKKIINEMNSILGL